MRIWHLLVIVVALGGFFLYRVFTLESRVEALSKTGEHSSLVQERGTSSASEDRSALERRLANLEAKFARLNVRLDQGAKDLPAVDKNTSEILDKLVASKQFDERVLSVVESEKQRMIDAQLKWHRDALVRYRMDALNFFAADQRLSPGQLSSLRAVLEDEVDRMVEILKTPETASDHEKALATWAQMVKETDKEASDLLNDEQAKVFRRLRRLEQQALTPWLPEKDRS